jgi:hypothetical protein
LEELADEVGHTIELIVVDPVAGVRHDLMAGVSKIAEEVAAGSCGPAF